MDHIVILSFTGLILCNNYKLHHLCVLINYSINLY